ncbi:MAG: ABC transporter ATP-binding protein [bacterium]
MRNAIEIKNLSKTFIPSGLPWEKKKAVSALCNLNLEVKEGECFALLGPNGAGKTTLIKILCSLILPDKGEVKIAGHDLNTQDELLKSKIGLVTGEERSFYWRLTGRQNLEFFAAFYNLPPLLIKARIDELAELLGITKQLDNRLQEYSTGTKQKVGIARSLLHDPPILLIDELTKNLDPSSGRNLRNFIKEELVAVQKKTVFFSTHQIPEAETLSDRIAIMKNGSIKACGTLGELRESTHSPKASLYDIFAKVTNSKGE